MAIVVFQHEPTEHAGRLGTALNEHGHKLRIIRTYKGDLPPQDLDDVDGVLVMGGPMDTDQQDQYPWMAPEIAFIKRAHDAKISVVGICLGAQLIAVALGGEVARMQRAEVGIGRVNASFFGTVDPLLSGIPWSVPVLHFHGCEVTKAPVGGTPAPLQSSPVSKAQSFKVGMTTYAFQYHFEATRSMYVDWIDASADWLAKHDYTPAQLKQLIDADEDRYRLFGEKLCDNIVTLLFPIDKRRNARTAHAANYHAHVS